MVVSLAQPPPPPAQTPNSAYIAEVAYLKTPLPNGTNYTPEVSRAPASPVSHNADATSSTAADTHTFPLFLPPQADRTALVTIAELKQNVSTKYTLFNWELSYEAQTGKPFPVKLEMVAYNTTRTPSNGVTILTLSSNSTGISLLGSQIAGSEPVRSRASP